MAPGSGRVEVDAPLDIAAVDRVRSDLMAAVHEAAVGSGKVVLDLRDCDFVDAVGYRMLCEVARSAELLGVALHVVGARAPVVRAMAILDAVVHADLRVRLGMHGAPRPRLQDAQSS